MLVFSTQNTNMVLEAKPFRALLISLRHVVPLNDGNFSPHNARREGMLRSWRSSSEL